MGQDFAFLLIAESTNSQHQSENNDPVPGQKVRTTRLFRFWIPCDYHAHHVITKCSLVWELQRILGCCPPATWTHIADVRLVWNHNLQYCYSIERLVFGSWCCMAWLPLYFLVDSETHNWVLGRNLSSFSTTALIRDHIHNFNLITSSPIRHLRMSYQLQHISPSFTLLWKPKSKQAVLGCCIEM